MNSFHQVKGGNTESAGTGGGVSQDWTLVQVDRGAKRDN